MSENDQIRGWLDSQLDRIQAQLTKDFDRAVIDYFGSIEEAYAQADNYVIEEHPAEISYVPLGSGYATGSLTLKMTSVYRIRPKRADERG